MPAKRIGIIGGKGEMGSYFARFFEACGHKVIVSDRRTKLTNKALAKQSDVVIVSVPMGVAEEVIEAVAPLVKKSGLLMDFTSLKTGPMRAMKLTKASYLGCHPLFGPTTSIEGQMVVLSRGRGSKWYQWWKDLLLQHKVEVKELTPKKHDELMSYIQSLTHFSYLGLADALRTSGLKLNDLLEYQSPIYRLRLNVIGRILNQDANLYGQIQLQNPDSLKVMRHYVDQLNHWIDIVEKGDVKQFEQRFHSSSRYFGAFKRQATIESDFVIEQLNRRKTSGAKVDQKIPICDVIALGPENSFSSLAAKKQYPESTIGYAPTISDVFELVSKGKAKVGLVPIENSTSGTVAETQQALFDSGLMIQSEFLLPIRYGLAGLEKLSAGKIRTIYSHGQPLKQCRKHLKQCFPKAELVAMPSTTAALKRVIDDQDYQSAVICSLEAANEQRMTLIAKDIGDYKENSTRFLVIGKKGQKEGKKTSIAFYFPADAPGSLFNVLGVFEQAKVNMTRIESAVNPEVPGGHVFYIDFEGSVQNLRIKKMLSLLRKQVKGLRIFGSF